MSRTGTGNTRTRGPLALALGGGVRGRVFAPYLWQIAKERCAGPASGYVTSASVMVSALQAARQLVDANAIHVPLHETPDVAIVALKRLAAVSHVHDLVAIVPGPASMAATHGNALDDAGEDFEDLARTALDAGCSVLGVLEPHPDERCVDSFCAVIRIAAHHGVPTLMLAPSDAAFLSGPGFDAIDTGEAQRPERGAWIAPARLNEPLPPSTIVSSSWSTLAGAGDVEWLRTAGKVLRNDTRE